MNRFVIFVEGGGDAKSQRSTLRIGFDAFLRPLKQLAVEHGKSLRIVLCGNRNDAYKAFMNERQFEPSTSSLLLVDSEEIVTTAIKQHLSSRETSWQLASVVEEDLYVMATTMETWIVSDRAALTKFYGQEFVVSALSKNRNIETVSKDDICQQLNTATENTGPGRYHKMRHAPKLLALMSSETVRSKCTQCERLFDLVEGCLRT